MKRNDTTQGITTRFSLRDSLNIKQEADNLGCTKADVIRAAWTQYQEQKQIQQLLLNMEQRICHSNFEMLCNIVNLSPDERDQTIQKLRKEGVNW